MTPLKPERSSVTSVCAGRPMARLLPLPIDFSVSVSMAWRRRAAGEPAQSWFRSLLTEAAGE